MQGTRYLHSVGDCVYRETGWLLMVTRDDQRVVVIDSDY